RIGGAPRGAVDHDAAVAIDVVSPVALLVDDEPVNLRVLEAVLASSGATFVRARTGAQALQTAATFALAFVVLDDRLPDMHGVDVARGLVAMLGDDTPPIVLYTSGDATREKRRAWHRAGILDVEAKPADPDILRAKIAVLLRLHRRSIRRSPP